MSRDGVVKPEMVCANCSGNCQEDGRKFSSELPNWFEQLAKDDSFEHTESSSGTMNPLSLDYDTQYNPQIEGDGSASINADNENDLEVPSAPEITVLEALINIFQFHWNFHKPLLTSTKYRKEDLFLCSDCAYSLAQMHDGFEKFTKSTLQSNRQSYLAPVVFPKSHVSTWEDTDSIRTLNNDEFDDPKTYKAKHTIKTSFKGDLKSLECRVKLVKLTPATAATVAAANNLNWQLNIPTQQNVKSENLATELDFNEDFILSSVPDGDDDIVQEILPSPRRKAGRPRKHPLVPPGSISPKKPKIDRSVKDCDQCGKKLSTYILLRQHIRIFHQAHYDCPHCSEKQSDHRQLREHLNTIHDDLKTEQCLVCEKRFFSVTELRKHGTVHSGKNPVTCSLCNGTFPSEKILKAHQLTHAESEAKLPIYICSVIGCNKRYTTAQLLQNHVRYLHDRRNMFVCTYPGCDKSFGTESYLDAHIVSHEKSGAHLCSLCGKNYKHKKDLRIHERRYHSTIENNDDLKPFHCVVCPKRYYRADHLRIHRVKANHYVGGEVPVMPDLKLLDVQLPQEFNCPTCNKLFSDEVAMKTHHLTHVEREDDQVPREHACLECNVKYASIKALEYHKKYMHQLKGAYACSYCPKSFGRLSSFKRHLQVHSISEYDCGDCGKKYKNKIDLFHHVNRDHVLTTDDYEHECETCSKRFYRRDLLRMHLVKSGHVAKKKPPPPPPPTFVPVDQGDVKGESDAEITDEHYNRVVYVVDSSDFLECNISKSEQLVIVTESHSACLGVGGTGLDEENVVITGEDSQGTIARVVMVDADGVSQEIDTEVVTMVTDEHGLELEPGTLAMYSIQL